MELRSSVNELTPWGIKLFDNTFIGLPKLTFNLLRTFNKDSSLVAIGHFLQEGLSRDERVALVCFDNPVYLMDSFKEYGFSFNEKLVSEKLIYLYYKPFFSHSLNFSTNHKSLFTEIKTLSKNNISRIAFFNSDVLFNLESHLLAESSAQRIMASLSDNQPTILGCYQSTDSQTHKYLHEVSQTILSSYIEIKPSDNANHNKYELTWLKSPLLNENDSISLQLTHDFGFNFIKKTELIKHG